jgi:hypothetical protein
MTLTIKTWLPCARIAKRGAVYPVSGVTRYARTREGVPVIFGCLEKIMSTHLNENQLLAVVLLASGAKAVAVAQELKITEETICRWKQLPAFRAATNRLHTEAMQAISCRLRHLGGLAVGAIEKILTDPDTQPRERLTAAFKILDYLGGAGVLQNIGPVTEEEIVCDDKASQMLAEMGRSLLDG